MSNLINFTIALEKKRSVQRAYAADAEATMRKHRLSDPEISALLSGDESAIYRAIGMAEGYATSKLVIVVPSAKKAA